MNDLVCYCYEDSRKDIENDLRVSGRALIMEKIQSRKKWE